MVLPFRTFTVKKRDKEREIEKGIDCGLLIKKKYHHIMKKRKRKRNRE